MSSFLFVFSNSNLKRATKTICSALIEAKWSVSAASEDGKIILDDDESNMQIASICLDGVPKDPKGFFTWMKKTLSACDIPSFGLLLSYSGTLRWGTGKGNSGDIVEKIDRKAAMKAVAGSLGSPDLKEDEPKPKPKPKPAEEKPKPKENLMDSSAIADLAQILRDCEPMSEIFLSVTKDRRHELYEILTGKVLTTSA